MKDLSMSQGLQTHAKPMQKPSANKAQENRHQPEPSRLFAGECAACTGKKSVLQRASYGSAPNAMPPIVHEVLRSPGQQLDENTDTFIKSDFGIDLSRVPTRGKHRVALMPNVAINEAGDRFEQEADRVAQQVMRMPTTAAPSLDGSVPEVSLQRKEAAVDTWKAKETLMHNQANASEDDQELSTGGKTLPASLREFYEMRFGRDFSQVRVHVGDEAIERNKAVNAHAFTFGNHVWLGRDTQLEPSVVLAHEMAHVVQQIQPPAAVSAQRETGLVRDVATPRHIQRFKPYWESRKYKGTRTHREVLPALGKESSFFTEAPVPNADCKGSDMDKKGFADMYSASTTVGIYFESSGVPRALKSQIDTKKNGAKFSHQGEAAPNLVNPLQHIVGRVDKAPTEVKVGDLKPSHGTIKALEGTDQVKGYLAGFKIAQNEINQLPVSQKWPQGQVWNISTALLGHSDVIIPDRYKYPSATGQASQELILKENGKVHPSMSTVKGKLYVNSDPKNDGIWNYFWIPDPGQVPTSVFPTEITKLHNEIQSKIIGPLLKSPVQKKPKVRTSLPTEIVQPKISTIQDHRRMIRRKNAAEDPSFDLVQWRVDHKRLTGEEAALEKQPSFKKAEFESRAAEAQDALSESTGLNIPASSAARQSSQTIDKVKFWTGKSSAVFGPMRKAFGKIFVKVGQFYLKVRDKFNELLHKRKSTDVGSAQIGLRKAAFHAAFRVLKMVASCVVRQTAERLMQSLREGVVNKLKSLIEGDVFEELEAKAKQADELKRQLELRAVQEIEGLIDDIVGPYQKELDKINQFLDTWHKISEIVGYIEWAIRASQVAECTTGVGCAVAVIEEIGKLAFAEIVVKSCWFQKKIIPLVNEVNLVSKLSENLAGIILEKVRTMVPNDLKSLFPDIKTDIKATEGNVNCEDAQDEDEAPITDAKAELKGALLDLIATVGEDRFNAYQELVRKYGFASGSLTAEKVRQIKDDIINSHVTAAEMRSYVVHNPTLKIKVTSIGDLLKEVHRSSLEKEEALTSEKPRRGIPKKLPQSSPEGPQQGKGPFGQGIPLPWLP